MPGPAEAHYRRDIVEPEDYRDELPDELNAAEFVGPDLFPNNNRRRIPSLRHDRPFAVAPLAIAAE